MWLFDILFIINIQISTSSKQNHATLLYGFPRNTEVTEKPVNLEEALSRVQSPLESLVVKLEVYGTYSLPESWKSKIVSYIFTLTFFKGGRRNQL